MRFYTFKIYPDFPKNKWYFSVHVFANKRSMYKFRRMCDKDGANPMRLPDKYAACCSAYNSTRKGEERQFGILIFTRASARKSGIVSHEIAHATTYWWRTMEEGKRFKWKNIVRGSKGDRGRSDERHAWLLGSMVAQYWDGWYQIPKNKR